MLQPPSNLAVLPKDIEFFESVGEGAFGEVFRAKWNGKGGGDIVAVKKVKIVTTNQKVLQEINREVDILTKLRHRNILQIYGACFLETQELWIVLEFMEGGSLYDLLQDSEKPLGWDIRARLALQAAKAVNVLHSSDPCILHRDIKSLNFLISKDAVELKLTDFGMSKVKVNSVATSTGGIGSCRWAAPEIIKGEQWTEKADIYSLGLTFYEIASRKIPFEKVGENFVVQYLVVENERPDIPNDCPPEFAEIIRKCWDPEPNARPTTAQLLQMLESFVAKYSTLNQVPKAKRRMRTVPKSDSMILRDPPPVDAAIETPTVSPNAVSPGGSATISFSVTIYIPSFPGFILYEVHPSNDHSNTNEIVKWSTSFTYTPGTHSFSYSFTIPSSTSAGSYKMAVGVYDSNWKNLAWNDPASIFSVVGVTITNNAASPSTVSPGQSLTISFKVHTCGAVSGFAGASVVPHNNWDNSGSIAQPQTRVNLASGANPLSYTITIPWGTAAGPYRVTMGVWASNWDNLAFLNSGAVITVS